MHITVVKKLNNGKVHIFEKATKFCEIFLLILTVCTVVKSKGKISQNFVAFSEYMNFIQDVNNWDLNKIEL